MMNIQSLNRFQAFAMHLLVSVCIALSSAALVFLLWYPGLIASASGVRNIFLMLLLVDVMLGPVITLIIFNTKKKELKRDLLIVAFIQLAALLYGLQTVFTARPVYVVFNVDRFDLVYANDIADKNLAKAKEKEYQTLPWFGYRLIAARIPDDRKERTELLMASISGGADLPQLPQYYLPYADVKTDVTKRSLPLGDLKKFNKDRSNAVDDLIKKYVAEKVEVGYLPLRAKVNDLSVIVNRDTGTILEMVDLKPWM